MRANNPITLCSDKVIEFIMSNWILLLLIITVLSQLASPIAEILGLISRTVPWDDPAVFQHGGWYITQGAVPYVDFWDVKPPLIYFLTTSLAILSGGNMEVLHILSWITSASAIVGISLVIGLIINKLTSNGCASLVGGGTPLILSALFIFPRGGAYPQFFSLFLGLLSIYSLMNDSPFLSGVFSVLATGFYYPEGIFSILILIIIIKNRNFEHLKWVIFGTTMTGLLILVPFLLWENITALFVETVLVSILIEGSGPGLLASMTAMSGVLGPAAIVIPFGVVGWIMSGFDSFSSSEAG